MRLLAYGICALLTAACGDALVEGLQNARIFGIRSVDAHHEGVLPVLALAALALVALGAMIVRARSASSQAEDWLRVLARDVDRSSVVAHTVAIVVGALGLVYLIEEYERGFGGGRPFDGAHATPVQTVGSLVVYFVCAALVAYVLDISMRGVVATCDALARFVAIVVALLERSSALRDVYHGETRRDVARHPATVFSAYFGDRAPPRAA